MGKKLHLLSEHRKHYIFWCEGCKENHSFHDAWTFNGDLERPTVSPSLLVTYRGADDNRVCHSFITDGQIQYLSDCTHNLAGQTVDLQDWREE